MSSFNEGSSSSDDDDMSEAIKEAKDSQFLEETLFCTKSESVNKPKDGRSGSQKSLRRDIEFVDESHEFGVTQDFKNFVASQLSKSLDKCVREIDVKNDTESSMKKKRVKTPPGIKLLANSGVDLNDIEILNNKEESIEHNKRRRKELNRQENSAKSISKCKEVAVQPEWILSKASTALWTNRTKGTVYRYKKSESGVLVEIS